MNRISRFVVLMALIPILALPSIATAADLGLTSFEGIWHNTEPDTKGIATVIITDADGIQIQVFSACAPDFCDWGVVSGTAYGRSESAVQAKTFLAIYDSDHGESVVTGSRCGPYLKIDVFTMAGGGRSDTFLTGVFHKE
jgi:hypothetical protein